MNIAFYAPMKSPRSPRPSGDRKIAALFMSALEQAGFCVELASEFRAWEGAGELARQQKIKCDAEKIARTLISQYLKRPRDERPRAWFSYHNYHKAPDWIGPLVCQQLGIPYLLAEASLANKQSSGPFDTGFRGSLQAIQQARVIFNLNPEDEEGLKSALSENCHCVSLAPFLDIATANPDQKNQLRQQLAARLKINPDKYWLLCVAMMRDDSKRESYEQLARSISQLQRKDWLLLVVGSGSAEPLVRDYFRFDLDRRISFVGKRDAAFIQQIMTAADLFVWPAINEAFGMAPLEALASGLPVVCGNSGGIGQIVDHGSTGLLIEQPDSIAAASHFAEAIELLLAQPSTMAKMSAASIEKYQVRHRIALAAAVLKREIRRVIP